MGTHVTWECLGYDRCGFVLKDPNAVKAAEVMGLDICKYKGRGEIVAYVPFFPSSRRNLIRTGRVIGNLAHDYSEHVCD